MGPGENGETAQDWKAIVRENFILRIVNFSTDDITYVERLLCTVLN